MDVLPLPEPIADFTRAEMARCQVPGVSIGVTLRGQVYADGFGVTNVEYPLPVTPDTQFQIGSTSKTFTATVAMTLVEEGKLDIEERVQHYLPDFRTSSEEESARVTIRNLLTHHTGWPGDYFKDFGRGDDSLARYVEAMARAPQTMPAGAAFSYCNSAFYLLARIIEVVSGQTFESIVEERLIGPLGMTRSGYFPEDTITYGVASGHTVTLDGPQVARPWHMARALNGGGGINASALDQVRYLQFQLGDGSAPGGQRILKAETMAKMQQTQAEAGSMCDTYGLGWMLIDHDGHRMVQHGGATNGFLSSFEMFPDHAFGCAILTNSDTGREAKIAIAGEIRRHFLGIADKQWPSVEVSPAALAEYAGSYKAMLAQSNVEVIDGALHLTAVQPVRTNRTLQSLPDPAVPLSFYAPDRTVVMEGSHKGERCEFIRDASGQVAYLRWDGRLARKL